MSVFSNSDFTDIFSQCSQSNLADADLDLEGSVNMLMGNRPADIDYREG